MRRILALAGVLAVAAACTAAAAAQNQTAKAITARVHGTFEDKTGGLGVLYGDLRILRFEVRNGSVVAVGEVVGSLADSAGNQLGRIRQELTVSVSGVASTCNQVQMELAGTEDYFRQVLVTLDKQTAGFDSRHGTTPTALTVLCQTMETLRTKPAPPAIAQALNDVIDALAQDK
jgi:hypothetical protein